MLELVIWSFLMALTPWALALACRLIVIVRENVDPIHAWDHDGIWESGSPRSPNLKTLSASGSMTLRSPRSWS